MKIGDTCLIRSNTIVWVSEKISFFTQTRRFRVSDDIIVVILEDKVDKNEILFMNNVPGHIYQVLDAQGRLLFTKRSQLDHIKQ